ncbi:uncharacterized protein LOC135215810 [Macrobrachium nipponense]|uniref:uncharacterized protein LOC135215810 n=1 Tax=Macrobrachium nipponense TaxID=159736 RepID=UPI0030C8C0D2
MSEAPADACAEALLTSWISCFRVPNNVTMDQGPAFMSEFWSSLACLIGTKHYTIKFYNPATNGIVERVHHSLKASLVACCQGPGWKAQLPWVLLGLRTTPRANSSPSPAENMYGETLTVPGEFFPTNSTDPDIPLARGTAQMFVPCRETYINRTKQVCL